MPENQVDVITETFFPLPAKRRRQLLPWWIKAFSGLFLFLGFITPVILVLGILGFNGQLSLYGFETSEPISATGLFVATLFLLKGVTAYGLLFEKEWAVKLAIADAVAGTVICFSSMLPSLFNPESNLGLRLEVVVLVPYFIKLLRIKNKWSNSAAVDGQ